MNEWSPSITRNAVLRTASAQDTVSHVDERQPRTESLSPRSGPLQALENAVAGRSGHGSDYSTEVFASAPEAAPSLDRSTGAQVGIPIRTFRQGTVFIHATPISQFDSTERGSASEFPSADSFFAAGSEAGFRLAAQAGVRTLESGKFHVHEYVADRDLRLATFRNFSQLKRILSEYAPDLQLPLRNNAFDVNSSLVSRALGPYLEKQGIDGYVLEIDAVKSTREFIIHSPSAALKKTGRHTYEAGTLGPEMLHQTRDGEVMRSRSLDLCESQGIESSISRGFQHMVEHRNGWDESRLAFPASAGDIEDGPPVYFRSAPYGGEDGMVSLRKPTGGGRPKTA